MYIGGTKRATSAHTPLLRLRSSEGNIAMSREIEPVRRSFCRHGRCTFTGGLRCRGALGPNTLSLPQIIPMLRLLDSSFRANSPWAWESYPSNFSLCSSQAL